jgi:hypothetical protein
VSWAGWLSMPRMSAFNGGLRASSDGGSDQQGGYVCVGATLPPAGEETEE